MQNTSHILMIKPVQFSYNKETAVNNCFQVANTDIDVAAKALHEFTNFVHVLEKNGIDVTVVEDTKVPHTPDSIFPNNWISFHEDGKIFLYPMFAQNRRAERKQHVLEAIHQKFKIAETIDLSGFEADDIFLEGTGSMVLDRENKIVYACLSPRTDERALNEFCKKINYKSITFLAVDEQQKPIYHTNVMMCVADKYVVICLEAIRNNDERKFVTDTISNHRKIIVDITHQQMNRFAGNMLQVKAENGDTLLVMSTQAYESLTEYQKQTILQFNKIVHADIKTIETNGGGSARCMMAEIFLPMK